MKFRFLSFSIVAILLLLAAATRVINAEQHWYNFSPIMAMGLFAGATLKDKRYAYLLPLGAYLLSDLYFQRFTTTPGFYGISQVFTYAGMALVALLGTTMGKPNALKIGGYAIAGSLIFFLISNLGVYLSGMYGLSFSGLVTTFVEAIPFYKENYTLAGDLIFSALFFGIYALVQQSRNARLATA